MGQWVTYYTIFFFYEDPFAEAEKGSCECKAAFAMPCSSIFRTFPSPFQFAAPWICCFPKVQLWSRTPLVIHSCHSTRLPCGVPRRTVGYCGGVYLTIVLVIQGSGVSPKHRGLMLVHRYKCSFYVVYVHRGMYLQHNWMILPALSKGIQIHLSPTRKWTIYS